ncbi:MAG: membrane integrity-associated transporter subunit PqiC [Desulfobacterales bacterium]|nr:MAG: membrane integrity-associated transporter subunit PqiC [Desulfobacterales bacterium]
MMHHSFSRAFFRLTTLIMGASLLVGGGCLNLGQGSSPPTRFFVLNSLYSFEKHLTPIANLPDITIGVGPIALPQYLDRPQIVTRDSQNEIQMAEFAQWAGPLKENFASVLAENLSILLATQRIESFPWNRALPIDYQIAVEVTRFEGVPGKNALLRARWTILDQDGKTVLIKRQSILNEPTGDDQIAALVEAESRTVANLSREIAAAIKNLAKETAKGK